MLFQSEPTLLLGASVYSVVAGDVRVQTLIVVVQILETTLLNWPLVNFILLASFPDPITTLDWDHAPSASCSCLCQCFISISPCRCHGLGPCHALSIHLLQEHRTIL